MFPDFPEGKRYNTFAGYYKRIYGERLQKLVIDAGFTCPNRDGKVGRGGCSFCDNAAFHPGYSVPGKSIADQIDEHFALWPVPQEIRDANRGSEFPQNPGYGE